jgi:DnaJ like chaperone protein
MSWGDGEFSTAVTALGAKLASADGPQRPREFEIFAAIFRPQPAAEADIRRLYRLARQTTLGFDGYARKLAKRYGNCPIVLERVLDGLFQLALSDGVVTDRETAYLSDVAEALGLSHEVYRAVRARRLGLSDDDPYRVLDVAPNAPDEVVRAAWRKALVEHHPDRALALGLPRELVEKAQIKAQAINAAFDRVMAERRVGFAIEPAGSAV